MDFLATHSQFARDMAEMSGVGKHDLTSDMLMPDFIADAALFERYIGLLANLHAQKHSIFGFQKGHGLYPCVHECTKADFVIMRRLADFLMLPADLTQKINFATSAIGKSDTASLTRGFWKMLGFPPYYKFSATIENWIAIGDLDGLKDACIGVDLTEMHELCKIAAGSGQLECMQWLYENGVPIGAHTCWIAASCGHIECLRWLHERGAPWYDNVCFIAAKNGHLACLQYAYEHGCDAGDINRWGLASWHLAGYISTTDYHMLTCHAIESGNIECLEYMREREFTFPSFARGLATHFKHEHVRAWLDAKVFN
jgi:hypothetical protein